MQDDSSSDLSENEYYVEKVLDKRVENGEVRYLIKWEGWSKENATWEPLENLGNINNLIEKFEKEKRETRKKLGRPAKSDKIEKTPRKKDEAPKKKSSENEQDGVVEKNDANVLTEFDYNIPEEVISVKRDKEGQILCLVKFKERSDGIQPDNAYVQSSMLKDSHPKILINYYESKIKFVEKK